MRQRCVDKRNAIERQAIREAASMKIYATKWTDRALTPTPSSIMTFNIPEQLKWRLGEIERHLEELDKLTMWLAWAIHEQNAGSIVYHQNLINHAKVRLLKAATELVLE